MLASAASQHTILDSGHVYWSAISIFVIQYVNFVAAGMTGFTTCSQVLAFDANVADHIYYIHNDNSEQKRCAQDAY